MGITVLFVGTTVIPHTIGTINTEYTPLNTNDIGYLSGRILFAPMNSRITYLIDNKGIMNHYWTSNYLPGESVRWLNDGTILRTMKLSLTGNGLGGGVQKIRWDGTITWEYIYNNDERQHHHDCMPLPNGNVLMIAWENKTRADAIAAGRNPNTILGDKFMPDHIVEIQPTGPTSGSIVWEWHVWDHLIQDYDALKANYGVVSDHPELVDINYEDSFIDPDWMHTNSVDYNEQFDQILLSVCNFNEIWVIDHSTTTAEAAGHTGGRSGKGGDLLYRWGNPATYRAGSANDQKYFNQHDATWINAGCPGAGHILVFNNGLGRPDGHYSSVDEIVPPVNEHGEYYRETGSPYGPSTQTWIYTANPPTSFLSGHLSGAERLPNGNTLICLGEPGKFVEVTSTGTTVWTYTNPYPFSATNNVFKIVFLPPGEEIPNQPPDIPHDPSPMNNATGVSMTINLGWAGGDPDVGDTVVYDVYFGSVNPPPKVFTGQSDTSYEPGVLTNNTRYYWQIVSRDSFNTSAVSSVWKFTTASAGNNPPNIPSNPNPVDHTTGVDLNVDLSWTGGDPDIGDTVVYDVYFGSVNPPPKVSPGQSDSSYEPGVLTNNTKYYWQIVSRDRHSESTNGLMWDFTTGDGSNNPPNTPTITGQTNGNIQTSYNYTIQATDPNDDDIQYRIDWGDNTTTSTDLKDSGETIIVAHTWETKGSYTIKVKAIDENYAESDWITLEITMPKTKLTLFHQLLLRFFDYFKFLILYT